VGRILGADLTYCVRFASPNIGYSGGTFGMMFKTTNGGANWRQENIAHLSPGYTLSIWAYNDSVIWAAGGGGMILHTTNGGEPLSFISNQTEIIADDFQLYQNYPNPFNSTTNIEFDIIKKGNYRLEVLDITGRMIKNIHEGILNAGNFKIPFIANDLPSGIYYYRLTGENTFKVKKMAMVK
jgi:hypothetical protein